MNSMNHEVQRNGQTENQTTVALHTLSPLAAQEPSMASHQLTTDVESTKRQGHTGPTAGGH